MDHAAIGEQQQPLGEDMARLRGWAQQHPDLYAGLWLDKDAGQSATGPAQMTIAVVCDPDDVAGPLRQLLEHPRQLAVVRRQVTYRELLRLKDEIAEAFGTPRHAGNTNSYVSVVGPDARSGKIRVGITAPDERLEGELADRYGAERIIIDHNIRPTPA